MIFEVNSFYGKRQLAIVPIANNSATEHNWEIYSYSFFMLNLKNSLLKSRSIRSCFFLIVKNIISCFYLDIFSLDLVDQLDYRVKLKCVSINQPTMSKNNIFVVCLFIRFVFIQSYNFNCFLPTILCIDTPVVLRYFLPFTRFQLSFFKTSFFDFPEHPSIISNTT